MFLKKYKLYPVILFSLFSFPQLMHAQTDSLFLTVDQLFERGVQYSLQLQADAMKEAMAQERTRTARTARLPELQIGLKGGFVGQPVVWERGLSAPLYPDAPDWSQNYAVDLAQPLYQGGKIRSAIHKADIEKQVAELQTLTDRAEIKLKLLNQYMNLFSLFKQHEILMRNIEESELRLHDIRRMKKEGLITNNDVLRSEMQLTNDRLSLQETENSIVLVSQQLDILLGQDENVLLRPDTALLYQAVALQSYDDYIVQAYANNPVMKLLRAQTELARNEIRSTKSFSLPGISLYASNTLARPVSRTLADMYNNNWNVGVSVSYPLSSLYKNNHKIKESKMRMSLRKNEEEQKAAVSGAMDSGKIDLKPLLPDMKSCSLTMKENGKAVLQADNGEQHISRELSSAELSRLSAVLNNSSLTDEAKRMRVTGLLNTAILSEMASQNFEQGMSEQRGQTENLKR